MTLAWSTNEDEGIEALTARLVSALDAGSRVLWFIPGGSNISISVRVLQALRLRVSKEKLAALTITLTDERYGAVGHPDSNWAQLIEAGFSEEGVHAIPVLRGLLLDETVQVWKAHLEYAFAHTDVHIAQFGIGADGHIAGALPHSPAISNDEIVCSYESGPYMRITLSTSSIARMDVAFVFAFGEAKQNTLRDLNDKDVPLEEQPAQVLKKIPEVYMYSDSIAQ